jgi:hypothetical protein
MNHVKGTAAGFGRGRLTYAVSSRGCVLGTWGRQEGVSCWCRRGFSTDHPTHHLKTHGIMGIYNTWYLRHMNLSCWFMKGDS